MLKLQSFGHLMQRADSLEKTLILGKMRGKRGLPESQKVTGHKVQKVVGWRHGLNGHEFEQTPRDGEGQGSLACCTPWGLKESDTA